MNAWSRYPTIYEINTWVWLDELSRKYQKPIDLATVPGNEWNSIASYGFDLVWLMGVWERSPAGIEISMHNAGLLADFRRALPDFSSGDNVGSPYCVRNYVVDKHLGGTEGLAVARKALAGRGVRLLLDFVPNHVAPDHPWATQHPEYFIHGSVEEAANNPQSFLEIQGNVYACGRDPYFPAWPDVLQLNAFQAGLRHAVIDTVAGIADQCDAVRCDMAMLVLNQVFERTWGNRAGQMLATEYWDDVIGAVKNGHPDFRFIAEAYWNLEWKLQQLGFDFCYDKRLYDRLEHKSAESVRLHLCADLAYQQKLLRFIENHDEPRAAAAFPGAKGKAAAVTTASLPGARLFHEGQFDGRTVRLPVFLGRRPAEPINQELCVFYNKLLAAINAPIFRDGDWNICERTGWADNQSCQNLVAWSWVREDDRRLIAVNLSDGAVQARIQIPWKTSQGETWRLTDALSDEIYDRDGNEIAVSGLYVELKPWSYCFLQCHLIQQTVPMN